jgi:hypothetical protein
MLSLPFFIPRLQASILLLAALVTDLGFTHYQNDWSLCFVYYIFLFHYIIPILMAFLFLFFFSQQTTHRPDIKFYQSLYLI